MILFITSCPAPCFRTGPKQRDMQCNVSGKVFRDLISRFFNDLPDIVAESGVSRSSELYTTLYNIGGSLPGVLFHRIALQIRRHQEVTLAYEAAEPDRNEFADQGDECRPNNKVRQIDTYIFLFNLYFCSPTESN